MLWGDPNFLANGLRWFFSVLDSIGYFFLGGIFDIFFTIANASFFQGDVINTFYTRVQLILGILMIFRISITLLQIIVNPDMFKDKQKGASSIVMRVAVMLVMLTLIVPIEGISKDDPNSLNQQIRDNGILFGFLYQFQNSVVQDNILGKLVLGYNIEGEEGASAKGDLQLGSMKNVGEVITSQIAHAFITPTLNEGFSEMTEDNFDEAVACPEVTKDLLDSKVSSKELLNHVNDTCSTDQKVYAFDYVGLGGAICSIVMTIIVIGFTLDVAVRAIKLALLRLIAPVPIISYISPGQEKNGAFGNWVKTLTSTYLSLFIRLIIIYFGIYLIILLRNNQLVTWVHTSNFLTTALANIFVIIGILVFMKQAPKFFQDMLGIKGDGKLFSGIGTMLGAAALTGGLAGSVVSAATTGYAEGQEMGHGKFRSALRGVTSGAGGLIGGAYLGGKTLVTADKKQASAVRANMQKGITRRASGSTFFGRTKEGIYSMATGSSPVDKYDSKIQAYSDFSDLFSAFDAKADADSDWHDPMTGQTVKQLKEHYDLLKDANASEPDLNRALQSWKNAREALENDVISGAYTSGPFAKQMRTDLKNAERLIKGAGLDIGPITNSKSFKVASFDAKDQIRNLKQEHKYKASKANKKYNS